MSRGLAVSELGLGTSGFGNLFRETTDADARSATDAAWAGDIRCFDTAPHYGLGLAEQRLGAALHGRPRDSYLVSTKVGRVLIPTPENADQLDDEGFVVPATHRRHFDFSRDAIMRSVDESLERLGLDDIDILYLHDPEDHWESASTTGMAALEELRDHGVVRAIGAGMNNSAMLAEFVRRCDIDIVMLAGRYTLLDQSSLDDLLPDAITRGVDVVAAGVYNSGLLSTDTVAADSTYEYRSAPEQLVAKARSIAEICARHGVTVPQAAVQFPLRHPAVVSVAIGARNAQEVSDAVVRYDAEIPDDLWIELEQAGLVGAVSG